MTSFIFMFLQGIEKIVHDMDWVAFTLLYEKDEDLILFQDLLIKHNTLMDEENFNPINLRKLPADEDYGYWIYIMFPVLFPMIYINTPDYVNKYFRPILKEIQNATETRILLHCAQKNILPLLRKAENLRLMGDYYAYVIVSLVRTLLTTLFL